MSDMIEAGLSDLKMLPLADDSAKSLWLAAVMDFMMDALPRLTTAGMTEGDIHIHYALREMTADKPRRIALTGSVAPHITIGRLVQAGPPK